MALSGSRDFKLDRDTLLKMALRKIGGLSTGGTPLTSQLTEASLALNVLIASWINDHIPIWVKSQADYKITVNTPTITIEASAYTITDLEQPYFRKNGMDRTLNKLTKEEYFNLIDKAAVGDPVSYWLDKQLSSLTLYLWPVPNFTTSVVTGSNTFLYLCTNDHTSDTTDPDDYPITGADYADYWERTTTLATGGAWTDATAYYSGLIKGTKVFRLQDMDATADDFDFTPNAYRALLYNLAVDLAPEFGNVKRELDKLKDMAKQLKQELKGYNYESGDVQIRPRF